MGFERITLVAPHFHDAQFGPRTIRDSADREGASARGQRPPLGAPVVIGLLVGGLVSRRFRAMSATRGNAPRAAVEAVKA